MEGVVAIVVNVVSGGLMFALGGSDLFLGLGGSGLGGSGLGGGGLGNECLGGVGGLYGG